MAGPNRSSLLNKLVKVLKQHYKPIAYDNDRPLLEHMLFACCLENAPHDKAQKVFEHLSKSFFDWNEVRVSTVKELAEAMRELPDPPAAAANLKSILQNVFEATYSFELESVKKQNIGVGIKRLEKMQGASPFVVAFTTQHALGGHSIPLDRGALDVLHIVGIASEAEHRSSSVAGLERAVPKNKGTEFGSLLHQLAADYIANPQSPAVRNILLAVNSEAKNRFPKRGQKKLFPDPVPPAAPAHVKRDGKGASEKGDGKAKGAATDKPSREAAKHSEATGKKTSGKDQKSAAKTATTEPAKKKSATGKAIAKPAAKAHRVGSSSAARDFRSTSRRTATKHLTSRKPR